MYQRLANCVAYNNNDTRKSQQRMYTFCGIYDLKGKVTFVFGNAAGLSHRCLSAMIAM